jgi:hypothetical protein
MEIVKMFGKLVLFLVGAIFLVGGLFCGAIGISSGPEWMFGLIGLAFAALGGYLVALTFGLAGKKKLAELPEIYEESGKKLAPPADTDRAEP